MLAAGGVQALRHLRESEYAWIRTVTFIGDAPPEHRESRKDGTAPRDEADLPFGHRHRTTLGRVVN